MRESREDASREYPFARFSGPHAESGVPDFFADLAHRYTYVRMIGRGGSASVHLVYDSERDAEVAMKVMHDEVTTTANIARFLREVEIERGLEHPHIVPVYESGSVAGRAWYTMPYINGQSLREKLHRERQLPVDEAFAIARQVADALDHAHARGILHRDVKPGNILMAPEGARVADFGIARSMVVASGDTITDSGYALGTPEYMSPEQAAGQRELDGRADIYAFGCVVYQMLAGEPPFTGPTAQAIIARHFQESPRSLRIVRPSVSRAAERAIARALEKVPADRFATAGEFIAALTAQSDTDGSHAATRQDGRGVSRLRRKLMWAGVVAALLMIVAVASARTVLARDGTTSLRARNAFVGGINALNDGHFAVADSQFSIAVQADRGFRRAVIWQSLVRWWLTPSQLPSAAVLRSAMSGDNARAPLSALDSLLLSGLNALADGSIEKACDMWSDKAAAGHDNAVVLYSLGACLRGDRLVVADERSRSGWRFRASYERAVSAYEQAFQLEPSLMRGLGAASLADLQDLFRTGSSRLREGRGGTDNSLNFRAFAELQSDTLVYVPYPSQQLANRAAPPSTASAIQHQRERMLRAVRLWSEQHPRDPSAARAVAVALDMLGDAEAPSAFLAALALADNAADSVIIAVEGVLVRMKHAIPDDTATLRLSVVLVDSLLRAHPPSPGPATGMLGALASFIGRGSLSAQYAAAGGVTGTTHALRGSAPQLLSYAALGGPVDSIAKYEALTETAVRSLPEPESEQARLQWLWRAAMLAFPAYEMNALSQSQGARAAVLAPLSAAVRGDAEAVRQLLAQVELTRASLRPADIMLDGLYAEAASLAAVNEFELAAARLDPTLQSLRYTTTAALGQIPRTGALVRSMAMRATIAAKMGDTASSRSWAGAVAVLWSGSDEFLQQTVREMKLLSR